MPKTISEDLYNILKKPREIKYRLCYINSQIRNLEECLLPSGIRYDKDNVQSSPSDKLSEIVAEISILEQEHTKLEADLLKAGDRIKALCTTLTDIEGTVIMMRFIALQKFEQIAIATNYTKGGIWDVYGRAIDKLEKEYSQKD